MSILLTSLDSFIFFSEYPEKIIEKSRIRIRKERRRGYRSVASDFTLNNTRNESVKKWITRVQIIGWVDESNIYLK